MGDTIDCSASRGNIMERAFSWASNYSSSVVAPHDLCRYALRS